jgi:4-amino-4-deoxy-L-arabinose transferase-like glycosyltransferase
MRFLVILIVVLLVAFALWPRQPVPPVEETFIAPQLQALEKAEQIESQYMEAVERANQQIERDSDGG